MNGYFHHYYLQQYQNAEISSLSYLFYLLGIRGGPILLLMILRKANYYKGAVLLLLFWIGAAFGIVTAMGSMEMGVKGLLLCILATFPQILCYLVVYGRLLTETLHLAEEKRFLHIRKKAVIAGIFFLGIWMECYWNPMLVRWYLKLM